ncbi:MAG: pilus assembly protein PilP [Gammaproteobacteria bacterium]
MTELKPELARTETSPTAASGVWRAGGRRTLIIGAALGAAALLSGCSGDPTSDLRPFVKSTLAREGRPLKELPPIRPYVVYEYQSAEVEDPFTPFYLTIIQEAERALQPADTGIRPDFDRNKEDLELHPLDSLRMMGTLAKGGEEWGIVRSPDAVIHRVQVGNYLGQNHGRVVGVSDEAIELLEIVPDGQGRWVERDASLALSIP